MQQTPELKEYLIEALRKITGKAMLEEGRVYGGGMHKMEPRELANVPASEISSVLEKALTNSCTGQFKAALVLRKRPQKRATLNCR